MLEPIYVIGYARVSSPKQAQIGDSLDVQEEKIKLYCEAQGWNLFPENTVYREPFTGSNTNRPVYKEILQLLKNNGKGLNIKHLVFWDFDRLTRAGTIDYDKIWEDVREYGVSLRDTTGVIQEEVDAFAHLGLTKSYDFAVARPSEDTERTRVEDARKEKIKILRRLIEPEIRLTQQGYHIGKPDYGFQNKKIFVENKKKCIQVRYEPEAVFIERAFQLRAENTLTDKEICVELNSMGYKSRLQNVWDKKKENIIGTKGGQQLDTDQLRRIIGRYTYCGVICEQWTNHSPIKAQYEGLVSIDVWNKANRGKKFLNLLDDGTIELQENINLDKKKRQKYNPEFPFKGVLLCDICKKRMLASASTGKSKKGFPAYHCSKGHKRNGHRKTILEKQYNYFLNNLKFTDTFLSIFEKTVYFQYKNREAEVSEITAKANINVGELEQEKSNLIKAFTRATVKELQQGIESEIIQLQKKIDEAKRYREKMEIEEADVIDFVNWSKNIMEHPSKILEDINSEHELIAVAGLIFERFPTYTELVNGTPKLSFIFKVSEQFKVDETQLVTLRRIELRFYP